MQITAVLEEVTMEDAEEGDCRYVKVTQKRLLAKRLASVCFHARQWQGSSTTVPGCAC